ncbi:MAG: Transport permease protein [Acidobacteriales bacterium]|nr:Transport permease protein [Terriglobales bacterium]
MANIALPRPASQMLPNNQPVSIWLPAASLWWREMVRFYRQRSRVVGVILSPLVFWLLLGGGFARSFRTGTAGAEQNYLEYFFPGALVMIVLFTSIFTMMSVIEDRKEGFLLSVMVAPIHRSAIVLGKVLGGTTLSAIQGLIFLALAPAIGIRIGIDQFALVVLIVFLTAFALTALGFAIAWKLDSASAFHAIVNLFLIPLWLLSGALFPVSGASGWIRVLMRINPLTYGVESLRAVLFPQMVSNEDFALSTSIGILATFSAVVFAIAYVVANRRSTKPAA